ncbi:hypothetical protein HDU97_002520 [Phlyctochytrium planicorne]|nr:hypothetical protein HDU97_002520 [Phlyctochytrium planicorne]
MKVITITAPASTANIGPGFDVLGIALSMHMSVTATIPAPDGSKGIKITYEGDSPLTVPLDAGSNLITRVALQVAHCYSTTLPESMLVHISNPIPLGRGLGSSGAAVVAGVALASHACGLNLSQQRMLDFALAMEGHPDNITASILGGFVASYVRSEPDAVEDPSNPSSSVSSVTQQQHPSSPATSSNNIHGEFEIFPTPKFNLGRHIQLSFSPSVKAVVTIPQFELPTKLARSVLPSAYPRPDAIFNMQRLAVLCATLATPNPDPFIVSEAMQDRLHQSYRQHLVPGLPDILKLTPKTIPGLLGVCVSGAGPTVLALATGNFDAIGKAIVDIFAANLGADGKPIQSSFEVLEISQSGLEVKLSSQ